MVCNSTHEYVNRLFLNLEAIVPSWTFDLYVETDQEGRWVIKPPDVTDRFIGLIAGCPQHGRIWAELQDLRKTDCHIVTSLITHSDNREEIEEKFRKYVNEHYTNKESDQPVL